MAAAPAPPVSEWALVELREDPDAPSGSVTDLSLVGKPLRSLRQVRGAAGPPAGLARTRTAAPLRLLVPRVVCQTKWGRTGEHRACALDRAAADCRPAVLS